jgi:hypothetical protein
MSGHHIRTLRLLMLGLPLFASGCVDPYSRPGTWQVEGVNDHNLAVMVADPRDLQHGRSGTGSNGQLSAAAVARLLQDKVRPLPDSNISRVGAEENGNPAATPAPSPAGGS